MTRFYDKAAWLLNSLGIALLVCGLVLVPQSRVLADPPVFCPGDGECSNGCNELAACAVFNCGPNYCKCDKTPSNCGTCNCAFPDAIQANCVCKDL